MRGFFRSTFRDPGVRQDCVSSPGAAPDHGGLCTPREGKGLGKGPFDVLKARQDLPEGWRKRSGPPSNGSCSARPREGRVAAKDM